jgi:two-component system, OmpR family, sensor histidine kinase ChvG
VNWTLFRTWHPSRIGLRLLAFNLLVVFVPAVGVLYLNLYETRLLQVQERAMVQQGRLLASALAEAPVLDPASIDRVFARLEQRTEARYRVYDTEGKVVADSARADAASVSVTSRYGVASDDRTVRGRLLYRAGAWIANARERTLSLFHVRGGVFDHDAASDESSSGVPAEVKAALAGRYGTATRRTAGQRSITLYSAVPVRHENAIIGAIVVSQSTFRILQALYDVRLRMFEIVIASILFAGVLTTLATMTIVRPLTRLRSRASALAERRGPLPSGFPGVRRKDELGELARALDELARRVNDQIQFLQSFAADVSHEFKNPLASIRTASEMMLEADSEADRRKFLGLMIRDVDRLERLVSGLREVAAVEGQIEQQAAQAVDLDELLLEIIRGFETTTQRPVGIALNGDNHTHLVSGSRERLTQVFENLIANAISFAPDHSTVDVDVTAHGSQSRVTIEDRGPGIPEAHLNRIFERFFTYRPSHGRREHLGLGLAIARQVVDGYGGTIAVSNRPDGGARFEVMLG